MFQVYFDTNLLANRASYHVSSVIFWLIEQAIMFQVYFDTNLLANRASYHVSSLF